MEKLGMTQLVHFYTTEGGTILDHVYVSPNVQAKVQKMPTYYSYHEGLLITLYPEKNSLQSAD